MAVKASSQVSVTDVTDGYSVTLTNEVYILVGGNDGAPAGLSCTTQVLAYQGNVQCSNVTIGEIECPDEISASIENNNTSTPTITFTTTAVITEDKYANIQIAVDGVLFTKKFSFVVAETVNDAKLELYLKKDEYGTLKSMIEEIADVINITSRGGLNLSGDRFTLDSTNTKISADGAISTSATLSSGETITAVLKGGGLKFYTTATTNHVSLEGHGLFIINDNSSEVVQISTNSKGGNIAVRDVATNKVGVNIAALDYGGSVVTYNSSGKSSGYFGTDQGCGKIALSNADGSTRAVLNAITSGNLVLFNSSGTQVVDLKVEPIAAGGQLLLRDASGNSKVNLKSYGSGQLTLYSYLKHVGVNIQGYATGVDAGYIEIFKDNNRNILIDGNNGYITSQGLNVNGPTTISGPLSTTSGIEIFGVAPHIDFHKDNNQGDFTSRLMESVAGSLYLQSNTGWGWFHAGGYAQESSKYVKKNIQDISEDEALKLLQLRPVSFDYKKGDTNRRGLIAEEVMDVYPELVRVPEGYDEDTFEYKEDEFNDVPSLDYSGFIPYLIKMVQIQQKEIDGLKEQVSELSKKLV